LIASTLQSCFKQGGLRRSMLAEKLLAKGDYNCDKEIRTLELLKIRFGEANLLNCEASPLLSPQMLDGPSTPSEWKGQTSCCYCSS
jgi:hypothetical protein